MNTSTQGLSRWHEGERAVHASLGLAERMEMLGSRLVRDYMPDQHRTFFAQLPFLIAGSLDAAHQPWASIVAAPPGFAQSPDPHHLRIDAKPLPGDALAGALQAGAPIGLLGIEPHTRRRNRMNGVIEEVDERGFLVGVQQSFGNCPRYIQAREPLFVKPGTSTPAVRRMEHLDATTGWIVGSADTFFIATAHPAADGQTAARGVDVSHRGGRPGFVRIDDDGTLTAPDFNGNLFFNTVGNIAVNPRAGLLFIDFETGDVLQVAVTAEIVWDGPEVAAYEGAERLLRMHVTSVVHMPAALPLHWGRAELSPYLEDTGRWPRAA